MKKRKNNNKPSEVPTKALLKNDSVITVTHMNKTHVFGTVDNQPYSVYVPKEWVKKWFYNNS